MNIFLGMCTVLISLYLFIELLNYSSRRLEKSNSRRSVELYELQKELANIEAEYRKQKLEDELRLLNAQLTNSIVKLKVTTKNGVTVTKEFVDTIRYTDVDSPYIELANESANAFIKTITDDDGSIEKGDTIYPSHMIESIQRIVTE